MRRSAVNSAKFLVVLAVLLFVPAGTLAWWQAWLYLGLQLAWLTFLGAWFIRRDPALAERRLIQDERGETDPMQRRLVGGLRLLGAATHVIAGLDHRFGWSHVPRAGTALGTALFVAGVGVVFAVFATNTYTSSIIAVEPAQTTVTGGPYRVVRHPFYSGTTLMGLAIPLILGSVWAALLIPLGWVLLVLRILAEERFLAERLPGWADYARRTQRRLVPGVW